jgi:tRNA A-37 threonylcarbamoyl transferase component Bud32
VGDRLTGERPAGRALGPYQLGALLGQGAMGTVYRARHTELGVERAIKLLRPGASADGLQRFEREARNLARVRHPSVVPIHEAGVEQGVPYLVMDLVSGRPLTGVLAEGRLPLARALALGADLARGVAALHEAGVVHRDLKPDNVLVREDGAPVIVDLGVAVAPDQDERLTHTGALIGTPLYMAPEQLLGRAAGPPADVYAVGLIIFELATGRPAVPPVAGLAALVAEVSERDRPAPSSVDASLPASLDALLAGALDRAPERRPHASALARRLDELAAAVAAGGARSARVSRWRRRAAVAAVVVPLVAVAALAAAHLPSAPTLTGDAPETAPIPSATGPAAPARTPAQVARDHADGVRHLRRVERTADLTERLVEVGAWLARWPDHPERPAALALQRRTRALVATALELPGGTLRAAFLDDRRLVAASDTALRIVEAASGADLGLLSALPGRGPLLVRPDGAVLVADGERCRIYEPGGRLAQDLTFGAEVVSVATSADGEVIAAGTLDGPRVVARATGRQLAPLTGHGLLVWGVALSPDARWLVTASGSNDDSVRLFDLQREGALVRRVALGDRVSVAVFLPRDGAFLVATAGGRLFRFRVDHDLPDELTSGFQGEEPDPSIRPKAHLGGIQAVVVSKDGRRAWSASSGPQPRSNELRAWDLETGLERYAVTGRALQLEGLDLSPDGTRLLTRSQGGLFELWETD